MIGNTSPFNECQGQGGDSHREYYLTLTWFIMIYWRLAKALCAVALDYSYITPRYMFSTWLGDFIPKHVFM